MSKLRELRQMVAVIAAVAATKLNWYIGHRAAGAAGMNLGGGDVAHSWRFIHHRSQRQLRRDRRRQG